MKAICIDSSNKPEHISEYEWIEEGMVYTITRIVELGGESKIDFEAKIITTKSKKLPEKMFGFKDANLTDSI